MLVNLLQSCHACGKVFSFLCKHEIHDNIPYCSHYKLIVKNFMYTNIQT